MSRNDVPRFKIVGVQDAFLQLRPMYWDTISIEIENDIMYIEPRRIDIFDDNIQVFTRISFESGAVLNNIKNPGYPNYSYSMKPMLSLGCYPYTSNHIFIDAYTDWTKSKVAKDIVEEVTESDEVCWWKSKYRKSVPFEKWKDHQDDADVYYRGLIRGKKYGI